WGRSPATGLVRVTDLGPTIVRVGDRVRLSGHLRFPRDDGDQEEFDYRAWLMRQGVAATIVAPPPNSLSRVRSSRPRASISIIGHRQAFPGSVLENVRERIASFIDATLDYPENAELRALVIGDRSGIDQPLRQPFALTGMAHLLVISGLHLGFVAAGAFLLGRLPMACFPALIALGYANKIAAAAAVVIVSA